MFGQELNAESYAICKADMLIKGQDVANIVFGNTLSDDGHPATQVRLHALQSAVRRRVEEGREGGSQGARERRLQRSLRAGPAARLRRLAAVPDAPHLEDAPGGGRRQPVRHRAQRLAAVHRRRGLGRERNPPLRAGERSGRGDHRPADRHVLQHRHLDLCLDRLQPQARAPQGQGAAHRRVAASGGRCARASAPSARR